MSNETDPENVVDFALEKLGGLDYLVLNHVGSDTKSCRLITEHDLLTGILCAFVRQPQRHHRLPVKLNPSRCSTPLEGTVKGAPRW
ncbi:hypothetical protein GOODEAATRI_023132 [Goodea atripinnis]|uniref:Uncharacterized protein n=1 Tax=Goodea atripinnis TaxID=208336 RepID=A0ABV0PGF9_9TELE